MIERISTGDEGLDQVLGGGLPAGSLIIVAGPPGSGKTILAQQICFANATAERRAVYYTTWSEPHDKMVRHLEPFGFFDVAAVGERVDFLHLAEQIGDDGADGFAAAAGEILRLSFETRPVLIVIDSSKALHDIVEPDAFRRAIFDLASKVAYSNAVLIMVGEYTAAETRSRPEFAVADGILQLENEAHGPVDRRWLRVLKMRGAEVAAGQHSFRLGRGGFEVFQRLETTAPELASSTKERASVGIPALDERLGGGIPRGDSVLVLGPSGIGKTLLSLHFTGAGLERGERCLHLSFQETPDALLARAAAVGRD